MPLRPKAVCGVPLSSPVVTQFQQAQLRASMAKARGRARQSEACVGNQSLPRRLGKESSVGREAKGRMQPIFESHKVGRLITVHVLPVDSGPTRLITLITPVRIMAAVLG